MYAKIAGICKTACDNIIKVLMICVCKIFGDL